MPSANYNFCLANDEFIFLTGIWNYRVANSKRGASFCNYSIAIITDKGLSAFPLKERNSAVKCPLV